MIFMTGTRSRIFLYIILSMMIFPAELWAKRGEPKTSGVIIRGTYQIQASGNGSYGKVIVKPMFRSDVKPKTYTVYKIYFLKSLEKDVQMLHIIKLEICDDLLLVNTENDGRFSCNITNGEVKLISLPQGYEQIKTDSSVIHLKYFRK